MTASTPPDDKKAQESESPALEDAERRLQVAAEARIQKNKTEDAGSTASEADTAGGKFNPDG